MCFSSLFVCSIVFCLLVVCFFFFFFFFSSRRRHTRCSRDWSSDVCSSDLSDDAVRSTLEVKVPALDVDCDAARPTARSRSAGASTVSAVERLLARLLPP